jgi:hypothetical protein
MRDRGAGLLVAGNATFHDIVISKTFASTSGAAVYNFGSLALLTLDKCQLKSNISASGSEIANVSGARLEIKNAIYVKME